MLNREQFHQKFYFFAIILLAISIPLSHFLMGFSTFLLFLNWIAEWNWKEKCNKIKENRLYLIFSAFYLVYAIGLINTTDWSIAGKEMLSKIYFLLAPIMIISSKELKNKELQIIFSALIFATLFGCLWNFSYSLTHHLENYREMSRFVDHIRFGMCVDFSIILCIFYAKNCIKSNQKIAFSYIFIATILILYLIYSQTLSAIINIIAIFVCYCIWIIYKSKSAKFKIISAISMIFLAIICISYFIVVTKEYFQPKDKDIDYHAVTENGRKYSFSADPMIENGYYIENWVCDEELQSAWEIRSDSAYTPLISLTLIRYLNSKGMRKDSASVMKLSQSDIYNIEQKQANYIYSSHFSTKKALYQTYFGLELYKKRNVIESSSLLERVEIWRTTWNLIKEHPILGVGIGNQRAALDQNLLENNSPIAGKKFNRGSHNQFLTFWLAAGIIPLLYFVFTLFFPFVKMRNEITFLYFALILMIFLSMFVEDTLNAQTSRTLYTIFAPLLLYHSKILNSTLEILN